MPEDNSRNTKDNSSNSNKKKIKSALNTHNSKEENDLGVKYPAQKKSRIKKQNYIQDLEKENQRLEHENNDLWSTIRYLIRYIIQNEIEIEDHITTTKDLILDDLQIDISRKTDIGNKIVSILLQNFSNVESLNQIILNKDNMDKIRNLINKIDLDTETIKETKIN